VDKRARKRDDAAQGADEDATGVVDKKDATPLAVSGDEPPDSATFDPIERRRFGPVGAVPSSRWVTVALGVVFVVLLGYAISTGNIVSVVGMVVIIVFVGLPLLVLTIVNHGRFLPPPSSYDTPTPDGSLERDERDTQDEREPLSGHYPARLLDEAPGDDGNRLRLN